MANRDRQILFDAAKRCGADWNKPGNIELFDAAIDAYEGIGVNPTGLADSEAFFNVIRQKLGSLNQSQVNGFNRLMQAMATAAWPIAWAAYGLATPWWETNHQMQPVEEGYYLGPVKAKKHQKSLHYYPWYGRGDVQLTWEDNYRHADTQLGLGGVLVADPNKALDPLISAQVLVKGMQEGWFTGKKLGDYLGDPTDANFKSCRKIINGTDKAAEIAAVAQVMLQALRAGGWA